MRMNALDGWRGIACLLVAIYHLNVAHSLYFLPLFQNGAPILELFFVISGFVMALAFADGIRNGRGAAAYLIRVFGRVFPLHWVTLAPLVLLASVKALAGAENGGFYGAMSLDALVPQVFNLQTWVGKGLTWNFPAWTLSGEMAAYLVFAIIMMSLQSRAWRLMASILVIIITGAVFASELAPREHYNVISLARCFVGFFVGYVLYDLWRLRQVQSPALATALEIIAVVALVVSLHARFDGLAYFLNYPLVAFLVYVFATGKGLVSKMIAIPPLLWLGKVSFSLYMIHAVVKTYISEGFYALERFTDQQFYFWFAHPLGGEPVRLISLGSHWANNVMLAAYLATVFAAAALLYKLVEEPTRKGAQQASKNFAALPKGARAPHRILDTLAVAFGRKRVAD